MLRKIFKSSKTKYCLRCGKHTTHSESLVNDWANSGGNGTVMQKKVLRCDRCGRKN